MPNPYSEIFKAPGAKGFASAGFVARMPMAMAPIGIVAMLSQTHGEYWLAGAVSATYALTNALAAPQISRWIDRLGQTRVVVPTTIVSVIAFTILLAASHWHWPIWTLFLSALLAAAMPSIPAMVRARWTEIFRDRPELNTAFAFELAADELVYIAGASISVGLSVALFPEAGILASTLFLAVGSAALILQRSTEPAIRPVVHGAHGSAIMLRPVQIITLALIFVGAIFATAEVSTVAITKELEPGERGQPCHRRLCARFLRGRPGCRRAEPDHVAAASARHSRRHHRAHHVAPARSPTPCRCSRSPCSSAAWQSRRPSSPHSA